MVYRLSRYNVIAVWSTFMWDNKTLHIIHPSHWATSLFTHLALTLSLFQRLLFRLLSLPKCCQCLVSNQIDVMNRHEDWPPPPFFQAWPSVYKDWLSVKCQSGKQANVSNKQTLITIVPKDQVHCFPLTCKETLHEKVKLSKKLRDTQGYRKAKRYFY